MGLQQLTAQPFSPEARRELRPQGNWLGRAPTSLTAETGTARAAHPPLQSPLRKHHSQHQGCLQGLLQTLPLPYPSLYPAPDSIRQGVSLSCSIPPSGWDPLWARRAQNYPYLGHPASSLESSNQEWSACELLHMHQNPPQMDSHLGGLLGCPWLLI